MLRGLLEFAPGTLLYLELALGFALAIGSLLFLRRRLLPSAAMGCFVAALLLMLLAAARPVLHLPTTRQVTVMVDISSSTRTAQYRQTLPVRLRQLLGPTPYRLYYFAATAELQTTLQSGLPEQNVDRTIFNPPAGSEAILLFSDVQFALPASAPPTFIAVDVGLQNPPDAVANDLKVVGRNAIARITNNGETRMAFIDQFYTAVPPGARILTQRLKAGATSTAVRLSANDAWPENDVLTLELPPPERSARWWVSAESAPEGFLLVRPRDLPSESKRFLEPAVIVLDNLPASSLLPIQQQRLQQYVRDLGGALLILGGDHAYAAGGYVGTILDEISPLASAPPTPTIHWILLGDASGSMSAAVDATTRFNLANAAMLQVLAALPLEDVTSVGSFAEKLRWWSSGRSVRQTLALSLPPADVAAQGPTNLEAALIATVAEAAQGGMPANLLLLTDAEAKIEDEATLIRSMNARKIHLHLLVIAPEGAAKTALPALGRIAMATGGSVISEANPYKWTAAARELMRAASPPHLIAEAVDVRSQSILPLDATGVKPWNRTWLKKGASLAATAASTEGNDQKPMAGQWMLGNGTVVATAFTTPADVGAAVADKAARPPRDPRFAVTWLEPAHPRVVVEVMEDGRFVNDLPLTLQLTEQAGSASERSMRIPQTAPGRYELAIDAPRTATFATVTFGQSIVDRTALPTRYAPEFDQIGNNLAAMAELARRTGGAVIPPTQNTPVDFRFPQSPVPLLPYAACATAAFIAAGLVIYRRSPVNGG